MILFDLLVNNLFRDAAVFFFCNFLCFEPFDFAFITDMICLKLL